MDTMQTKQSRVFNTQSEPNVLLEQRDTDISFYFF